MFDIIELKKKKIALLAGGKSSERDISLASGDGAQAALQEAGFSVERLDPAVLDDLKRLMDGEFDIAFLCTHGRGGEDGALQGFLETIGVPYTGSGVFGSAVSMDKTKAKMLYEAVDIPTPPSLVIQRQNWEGAKDATTNAPSVVASFTIEDVIDRLGDKCAIKAASEGSSVGVYIEEGADRITQAIESAFQYDDTVLVERYIPGTELTVVVLGDETFQALPIIEIVPKNASYDFESKYAPGGSEHICPARIDTGATERIQAWAIEAHKVLGCSGVSRTDFILDPTGEAWALETNTLPGMTETSLLPDAARAAGMTFPEVCTDLMADALRKAGVK